MAKPENQSDIYIAIRLFPLGATVKKQNHKVVNLWGRGYKQSVYNTAKVYIQAVYIF